MVGTKTILPNCVVFLMATVTFADEAEKLSRTVCVCLDRDATIACPVEPGNHDKLTMGRWTLAEEHSFIAQKSSDGFSKYIDPDKYVIEDMPSLTVRRMALSDETDYRCLVTVESPNSNPHESTQLTGVAHLRVCAPVRMRLYHLVTSDRSDQIHDVNNSTVKVVSAVTLTAICFVNSSSPATNVSWLFNDQVLSAIDVISIQTESVEVGPDYNITSNLTIAKTDERHSGTYTCVAKHDCMEQNAKMSFTADLRTGAGEYTNSTSVQICMYIIIGAGCIVVTVVVVTVTCRMTVVWKTRKTKKNDNAEGRMGVAGKGLKHDESQRTENGYTPLPASP